MKIGFAEQIKDKPTFFVEKIHKCLRDNLNVGIDTSVFYPFEYNFYVKDKCRPKLHTITKDEENKYDPGEVLEMMMNDYQFTPSVSIISTQEIFMTRRGSMLEITIAKAESYLGGDDFYLGAFQQGKLAENEGFDEYDGFRNYFLNAIEEHGKKTGNYWFKGKIIHWTDFRYENN